MNLEQIDTSTTAGKAEVMRLAAEGRRVASRQKKYHRWLEVDGPVWDWDHDDYAIISEPVGPEEVWVFVRNDAAINVCKTIQKANELCGRVGGHAIRYIRADLAGEGK